VPQPQACTQKIVNPPLMVIEEQRDNVKEDLPNPAKPNKV
jgi:hypothetical protein